MKNAYLYRLNIVDFCNVIPKYALYIHLCDVVTSYAISIAWVILKYASFTFVFKLCI